MQVRRGLFAWYSTGAGRGSEGVGQQLTNLRRIFFLLRTLDEVFQPPLESDSSPSRKEPASVKKLLQGDACWTTRKGVQY
jgi:hypothetical protein